MGGAGAAPTRHPLRGRSMPSYLDLGVIVIVLISAFLSMVRGFTREVLAIGSWLAAAAAAYFFYPYLLPYATPYIHKEVIAQAVCAAAGFLRHADRRLDLHGQGFGRHSRQQDRRARPLARLSLWRRARFSARRRRLRDFQLARRRQAAAAMGQGRQDAALPDRDRRLGHRDAARRRRAYDRELAEGGQGWRAGRRSAGT